jgi:hypothetical protein
MTAVDDEVPAGPEVDLYGRPTAIELLQAAREFMADRVFPATQGALQFHVRVTLRVLDTVIRELELGAGHLAAHEARLAELGYDTDEDLVAAIRAGWFDDGVAGLAAILEEDVRARLEVSDPRYLAT